MATRIAAAGSAPAEKVAFLGSPNKLEQTFHYWQGASGKRYLHTVYPLVMCPRLPRANYILVRRKADGSRHVLRIGQTVNQATSLNLAHLRRQAARIGANEIHIHLLADSPPERDQIEIDLTAQYSRGHPADQETSVDHDLNRSYPWMA